MHDPHVEPHDEGERHHLLSHLTQMGRTSLYILHKWGLPALGTILSANSPLHPRVTQGLPRPISPSKIQTEL